MVVGSFQYHRTGRLDICTFFVPLLSSAYLDADEAVKVIEQIQLAERGSVGLFLCHLRRGADPTHHLLACLETSELD
jgi:hypothetical protein